MTLHHATHTISRIAGALVVAAALLAGAGVDRADAATPSVPRLTAVQTGPSVSTPLLVRWAPGSSDTNGYRVNLYKYKNDVLLTWFSLAQSYVATGAYDLPDLPNFSLTPNTRYCVGLQATAGVGQNVTNSKESNRLCATTPPPAPDLTVMRITGQAQLVVGESSVYEVVLSNHGGATTNGTSLSLTSVFGQAGMELVGMETVPAGFLCTRTNILGEELTCTGPLAGTESHVSERVAIFRVRVRGADRGTGELTAVVITNGINDSQRSLTVTVK
jgi:hypothetical protein